MDVTALFGINITVTLGVALLLWRGLSARVDGLKDHVADRVDGLKDYVTVQYGGLSDRSTVSRTMLPRNTPACRSDWTGCQPGLRG